MKIYERISVLIKRRTKKPLDQDIIRKIDQFIDEAKVADCFNFQVGNKNFKLFRKD